MLYVQHFFSISYSFRNVDRNMETRISFDGNFLHCRGRFSKVKQKIGIPLVLFVMNSKRGKRDFTLVPRQKEQISASCRASLVQQLHQSRCRAPATKGEMHTCCTRTHTRAFARASIHRACMWHAVNRVNACARARVRKYAVCQVRKAKNMTRNDMNRLALSSGVTRLPLRPFSW